MSLRLELWQTEWCPASRRVRQRLTELGLAYLVHQVPVERDQRTELDVVTGQRSIPVLVAGGEVVEGEQAIRSYLDIASGSGSVHLPCLAVGLSGWPRRLAN